MKYELRNAQNEVVNTILLNSLLDWEVPEGHTLVEVVEQEPSVVKLLTQLEFLRRFTVTERITIRSSPDPVIQDFLHLVNLAQDVNLDDPDTVMGVVYLEQQQLIGEGRAAQILAK